VAGRKYITLGFMRYYAHVMDMVPLARALPSSLHRALPLSTSRGGRVPERDYRPRCPAKVSVGAIEFPTKPSRAFATRASLLTQVCVVPSIHYLVVCVSTQKLLVVPFHKR
jgi:hypothetical protein